MFSLSKSSGFLSPVRFILLIFGIYITMGLTAYLVLTTEWRKMSKAKWETSCFPVCVYGFKKKYVWGEGASCRMIHRDFFWSKFLISGLSAALALPSFF